MAEKRSKKHCYFKSNQIPFVDYKDIGLLTRFLTDQGKILPRRITGVSAFYQRQLTKAVKTARQNGLIAATLTGTPQKRAPRGGDRQGPRGERPMRGGPRGGFGGDRGGDRPQHAPAGRPDSSSDDNDDD